MSHFAKVEDGVVTQVIVATSDFFDTFIDSSPGHWLETFVDASQRKNFAGIGYTYDADRDAFIRPKPYASWTLNEDTCDGEPPVANPGGRYYSWNEETQSWDEFE
jgi:hypothetical protein